MTNSTNSTSNQNMFKKKKKEAPLKQQQDILDKASGLMNTKEEDWEILGRSIGMQLRDLNQRQHIIARKLISDVIFYATLDKLSEESFVGLTTNNYQSKASYPWFTPLRSSSSQSEFHRPVRTSSPYQSPYPPQQQMQSSHPSASTQYHSQSSNSPHYLPPQQKIQSSHSSQHHRQPSNSRHNLPLQKQIQSSHLSQSPEYHSQSSNSLHYFPPQQQIQSSPTVEYTIQAPHPSDPLPSVQLHIPSPPHSTTLEETNDGSLLIEGNGDIMKDFLIFGKTNKNI